MMTRDEQFFYDNAGWRYDPKVETLDEGRLREAKRLAEAEARARNEGWMFEWRDDEEGCIGCDCGDDTCPCYREEAHESLVCLLWDNGETPELRACLGSICCPTREYRRVVEAELALEAMA